jgi:hypothetical protein
MSTRRKPKFSVGDRIIDRETGTGGRVIHVFSDATLADVVAVRFDVGDHAVAVPIDTIKAAPSSARRRKVQP